MEAELPDPEDRVVLGRKDEMSWSGFQWTGEEPEGLDDAELAETLGAQWEGDELVTYNPDGLKHRFEQWAGEWQADSD